MYKVKSICLISLVLGLSLVLSSVYSQSTSSYEIAFYEAGLLHSNGKGIDVDIANELSRRTGIRFVHTVKPRARIWHELQQGTLAITVSGVQTPERTQFADFYPYIAQKNMAILYAKDSNKYPTADSFVKDTQAKVAVVRGFVHGTFFDSVFDQIRKTASRVNEVPAIDGLFTMLKAENRISMVVSLPVFYRWHLAETNMTDKVIIRDWDVAGTPIVHHLVVSKTLVSPADRQVIQAALISMKTDGTLENIYKRYLQANEVKQALQY